ncbi:MAG: hypothetical protein HY363_03390 [Candidatus Aenigmarchaeota archaeon]|nr:hypothetical protein [Candidatus Aenigmarchaeota archaeon]
MAYAELANFRKIINRPDFDYVSDKNNIKAIENIILYKIASPDGNENVYIETINKFSDTLMNFCVWMKGKGWNLQTNFDFDAGCAKTVQELQRTANLLRETPDRRKHISMSNVKKFLDFFFLGLAKIYKGIKISFDQDILGLTNIKEDQIIRYFLDKVEGLGKMFAFNTSGTNAAARKIPALNKLELITAERLLRKPSDNQVRTFGGWRDIGARGTLVRILQEPGTNKIYYVFKIAEHRDYQKQLNVPPSRCRFAA